MNTNSNTYIFIYSSVLVIIVAAALSFAAIKLQPLQQKNIENEKRQNILASVGIESTAKNADTLYKKYIVNEFVINSKGKKQEGIEAFSVKLKDEIKKSFEKRSLPVYLCNIDSKKYTIIPVRGKGLWGPIWGYVALENDLNTIHGVVFDHKTETPGLGAEIATKKFQKQFVGKTIFDAKGNFTSIFVYKGGKGAAKAKAKSPEDLMHGVDAISGGTLTSKGLQAMLKNCLEPYQTDLKSTKNQ